MNKAILMVTVAVGMGAAFASLLAQTAPTETPESVLKSARSRMGAGYLKPEAWPDSLALLPKPPADGSSALKRDRRLQVRALAVQSTPRFAQAKNDADIFLPTASRTMACAAGFDISADATPAIDRILRRTMADFGSVTAKAKNFYKRPRPFMINNQPICTPDWDKVLRSDGSYPSGHAAIGYGWGFILAEIVPARKSQLIARGRAFAESRRFCNVHFQSDVEAGMTMATTTFAKLKVDSAFQNDLATARIEAQAAKSPPQNCAAEKAALAIH